MKKPEVVEELIYWFIGILIRVPGRDLIGQALDPLKLPCKFVMPCGNKIPYQKVEEIPWHDVSCPCGDKYHWLVKIEVTEEGS